MPPAQSSVISVSVRERTLASGSVSEETSSSRITAVTPSRTLTG